MAILRSIPRVRRMPSYRGRVMVDAVRGVLRVRRWPAKRGTPTSERQLWWIDWFRQANLLAKYADPAQQVRSKEMAKGTGMYPRDVLLKAMRGRLYIWVDQDGWRWYSMAAIGDISESLDVLAQSVGSLLVRAADRWRNVAPGDLDDILTHKGPGEPPAWEAPAPAPGAFAGALVENTFGQSIPNATSIKISYTTEHYDTDGLHDNVINPTRLTVPAGWSKVRLTYGVRWTASAVGRRFATVWKNGANFPGLARTSSPALLWAAYSSATPAVIVVPGDYFECVVYQDSGGTQLLYSGSRDLYFSMEQVE